MSESKAIPRRMLITDPNQLPNDYSSTPGGTLYSTTPGGTRIVYDRSFLLHLRNSPISKTPPKCSIPNELIRDGASSNPAREKSTNGVVISDRPTITIVDDSPEQFPMEM